MIDVTQDIHSMTTFKRNSSGLMKRIKKTGRPLVLTVKGKAEAVVLDAAAYRDEADLRNSCSYIRMYNPRAARAWLKGARQRIKTLAQHPERCPLAPETTSFI